VSLAGDYPYAADSSGLVSDKVDLMGTEFRSRSTGNGLMYSAELSHAFHKTNHLPGELMSGVMGCEIEPGHWSRHSGLKRLKMPNQGPDDLYGVMLFSHLWDEEIAKRWLVEGRRKLFMINAREPGKWRWGSWWGRFPALVAHTQFAAGEIPSLPMLAWWVSALMLAVDSPRKKQDNFAIGWAMAKVAEGKMPEIDRYVEIFRRKFKKKFPHGMGQVRLEYGWSEYHPNVKFLWDDF